MARVWVAFACDWIRWILLTMVRLGAFDGKRTGHNGCGRKDVITVVLIRSCMGIIRESKPSESGFGI